MELSPAQQRMECSWFLLRSGCDRSGSSEAGNAQLVPYKTQFPIRHAWPQSSDRMPLNRHPRAIGKCCRFGSNRVASGFNHSHWPARLKSHGSQVPTSKTTSAVGAEPCTQSSEECRRYLLSSFEIHPLASCWRSWAVSTCSPRSSRISFCSVSSVLIALAWVWMPPSTSSMSPISWSGVRRRAPGYGRVKWSGGEGRGDKQSGQSWSGLQRGGVEWSRVEWSGVEWSGVDWSGVEWSGVQWSTVVEWSGAEWSGVEWSGVECSAVQCSTGVEWSGVQCSAVEHWSVVEWSAVQWSGVERSGVEWRRRSCSSPVLVYDEPRASPSPGPRRHKEGVPTCSSPEQDEPRSTPEDTPPGRPSRS